MALLNNISRKFFLNSILQRHGRLSYRFISTSGKKADTSDVCERQEAVYKKDFTKPLQNDNWVSYGANLDDKTEDRFNTHYFYFLFFTVALCGYTFVYLYSPSKTVNEWARREAFIVLHEREQLGLEPVDPNYVDPSKIVLPPDEELSEDDIVI